MLILIVGVTHSWCNTQGYSENYNIVVIYCGVLAQYWMWIVLTAIIISSIIITEMMRKWRILAMNISFYPISFHFLPLNSHYFSRNTLCSLLIVVHFQFPRHKNVEWIFLHLNYFVLFYYHGMLNMFLNILYTYILSISQCPFSSFYTLLCYILLLMKFTDQHC